MCLMRSGRSSGQLLGECVEEHLHACSMLITLHTHTHMHIRMHTHCTHSLHKLISCTHIFLIFLASDYYHDMLHDWGRNNLG